MSNTLEENITAALKKIDDGNMDYWYVTRELAACVRRLINEKIQQLEKDDSEGEVVFYSVVSPGYTAYHDGFMWGAHWFAENLKK